MEFLPSRRTFKSLAHSRRWIPVSTCLPLESDARSLFEAVAFRAPNALLESARVHPVTGRYSLIVGEPACYLTAYGDRVCLQERGRSHTCTADPFQVVEQLLRVKRTLRLPGLPPFVGGAVGAIGFEACRMFEKLPVRAQDDLHLPDLAFLFCDQAIVLDHLEGKLWPIILADPIGNLDRAYDEAVAKVEALMLRVTRVPVRPEIVEGWTFMDDQTHHERGLESTHTRAAFEAMVRQAKEFIAEGQIYQANLSQRFTLPLRDRPWELYRRLTDINPSPFAAFVDLGPLQIVSASPERFLRIHGSEIETRPIAGTRPKGRTALETAYLRKELLLNEKERAEHLMLVDLERNDLGRVCRYGSVQVGDLMALEEYSHVIHIVSNVGGRLQQGVSLKDLMAATFPGGTISGCPKIRCLEVIDALEPVRRHFYAGSLGYFSYSGEIDLNLLIRTAFVKGREAYIHAGAGIVADSDPSREYDETLHKARALLETLAPVRPELVGGRTARTVGV